jgi:hypothetical protein
VWRSWQPWPHNYSRRLVHFLLLRPLLLLVSLVLDRRAKETSVRVLCMRNFHYVSSLRPCSSSSFLSSAQLPLSSSRVAPTLGSLYMSDQERDTGRGSGTGVQVITKDRVKETVEEDTAAKEDLSNESWWRVILHNDEIHTFDYVTMSITKVCWHYFGLRGLL